MSYIGIIELFMSDWQQDCKVKKGPESSEHIEIKTKHVDIEKVTVILTLSLWSTLYGYLSTFIYACIIGENISSRVYGTCEANTISIKLRKYCFSLLVVVISESKSNNKNVCYHKTINVCKRFALSITITQINLSKYRYCPGKS